MSGRASMRAATLTVALTAVFTIGSELSSAIKGFFTLFGHHWIGKSIVLLAVFLVTRWLLGRSASEFTLKDTKVLIWFTVASGLAILAFYVAHFMG